MTDPRFPRFVGAVLFATLMLGGCAGGNNSSGTARTTNSGSTSSLVGDWKLASGKPKLLGTTAPALYEMQFDSSRVRVTMIERDPFFVPNAKKSWMAAHPSPVYSQTTTYPYESLGGDKIRIIEGSEAREYKSEIDGDRLFLTPVVLSGSTGNAQVDAQLAAASGPATVFVRSR